MINYSCGFLNHMSTKAL